MRAENIKQLIETGLKNATAIVSGDDGRHFSATVISPDFSDKNRVQKQQMVYAVLNDHIHDGTIHAISIKTYTPTEWQNQQAER